MIYRFYLQLYCSFINSVKKMLRKCHLLYYYYYYYYNRIVVIIFSQCAAVLMTNDIIYMYNDAHVSLLICI